MVSLLYSYRSDSNHKQGESVFKTSGCNVHNKVSEHQIIIVRLLALFAFVAAVPWACGQTPTQPVSQGADLYVTADEVSLDLVVHDKKNRPVLDLKQGEIAVTDDGSPVELNSFRLVSNEQKSEHLITLIFDRPSPAAGKTQETDPSMMKTARDAATKILMMAPASGFSFSVLTVEGRLRLQVGFTSDRKAIAQAIDAATKPVKTRNGSTVSELEKQLIAAALTGADPSGKPVGAKVRALDLAMLSALNDSGRIAQDQHLRPFLAGLLALAQSQQQIKERKALIFFTSFQGGQIDLRARDAIKSIIGSANQAGESIYIVDLNSNDLNASNIAHHIGVQSQTSVSQDYFDDPGHLLTMESPAKMALRYEESNNDDMKHLAEGTGGSYITRNRLQKSLEQMIQDMTTYYVASYVPSIKEYDGKFRSVGVKTLRTGLKIRSKTGYLALPPRTSADSAPRPFELPLLKVLSQSRLPADLTFRTAILRMGDLPEGYVNTLAIEAPFSNLEIREDSSTNFFSASLSIVAVIKDKSGVIVERFSEDIPRRRIQMNTGMSRFGAITFLRHFIAPAGQYVLEAAILDHNSGKAGAQRVAFEIPNASGIPSLSDMLLVRQKEPFSDEDDPAEPLRHGNDRVTPNLSGQLLPGAKDVSVFFTAHADPHAPEAATLTLQVFRNGKALGGQPMISHQDRGSEFSSYLTSFSISPPVDGLYEVKAILRQGGKKAETSASFTLAGVQPGSQSAEEEVDSPLPSSPAGPLVITIPANPTQRPAPDVLKSILADATQYAMNYKASLPNFMCEQVTNRSVNSVNMDGTSQWKHRDKFTELLTYFNHEENRIPLELEFNGSTHHDYREDSKGVMSAGEFGVTFSGLFSPSSKADFQWKETGVLGDGTVQVFDYRVSRENSTFNLRGGSNDVVTVGYHGQVFIDSATRTVRRITQIVDDVPKKFPFHAVSVSVDYDYVVINNHDYMLPISAQVITRKGHGETDLNEIEYRNFRRFGSTVRILDFSPAEKP
jgi:VWFA-related protein